MATLQVDPKLPDITPAQSLTGRRREFCVELLGDGGARIFVRGVEKSSFKAAELQRAILFQRLACSKESIAGRSAETIEGMLPPPKSRRRCMAELAVVTSPSPRPLNALRRAVSSR